MVSIIVLLILAGVTINAISGSDSAPAKANESSQKNDIGAAKDDISLAVVNAKMQGMETAYVRNGVSSTEASTTVGQTVINSVLEKNGTNIGKATIDVEQTEENGVKGNASISIYTTDFVVDGTITIQDGVLTWGEIEQNVPRIVGLKPSLELDTGENYPISVKLKGTTGTIYWNSSDPTIAKYDNGLIKTAQSIDGNSETVTITASANGCESKTCTLIVNATLPIGEADSNYLKYYGKIVNYPSQDNTKTWQFYFRDNKNTYIIASTPTTTSYRPSDIYDKNDTNKAKYADSNCVSDAGKKLNPMIQDNKSWFTDSGKVTWKNMRALAWFTDTAETDGIWSNCTRSGAVQGEFALASPSIELLLKSYNAAVKYYNDNKSDNQTTRTACTSTLSVGSFGYKMSGNFIVDQENNGLYNNGTSYWISSPGHSGDATTHRGIYIDGGSNTVVIGVSAVSYNYYAVRPLVCIPNTSFQASWLPEL